MKGGGGGGGGGGGDGINQIYDRNQEATLYVGNVDQKIDDEILWELMVQAGPISSVQLPKDKITNQHMGYGFIEFKNEEDADYAIKVLNMVKLFGKPIRLNKSSRDKRATDVGANLFIGNLNDDVDEKLLYDTFSSFGLLLFAKVMRDEKNESKGFGFISYDAFESADAALSTMNGQFLCNRPVQISYAYKKDSRGERHGSAAERLLAEHRPEEFRGGKAGGGKDGGKDGGRGKDGNFGPLRENKGQQRDRTINALSKDGQIVDRNAGNRKGIGFTPGSGVSGVRPPRQVPYAKPPSLKGKGAKGAKGEGGGKGDKGDKGDKGSEPGGVTGPVFTKSTAVRPPSGGPPSMGGGMKGMRPIMQGMPPPPGVNPKGIGKGTIPMGMPPPPGMNMPPNMPPPPLPPKAMGLSGPVRPSMMGSNPVPFLPPK